MRHPRRRRSGGARRSSPLALAAAAALAALGLMWVPAASADTSQSSNWAGYAAHRSGVKFDDVLGTWTQPALTCTPGQPAYSAVWVGLGGYSVSSKALEQIGTEDDCAASGRHVSTAWYELVPAASRTIRFTVRPGDRVRAAVAVLGHQVLLQLRDLTRNRSFTKRLTATGVDIGSAEWIVEAPSVCANDFDCHTLPLADFGSADFRSAGATSTGGHTGAIQDRRWSTTRIDFAEAGRRFVTQGGAAGVLATAVPSALSANGTAFTVTYQGAPISTPPASTSRVAARRLVRPAAARRLVHPAAARRLVHPAAARRLVHPAAAQRLVHPAAAHTG